MELGIQDTTNPTSTTTDLDFKDTWHGAIGAQYRINDPWRLNFGIACDSEFQDGSDVSYDDTGAIIPGLHGGWKF